jgi:elongation factor P
MIKAIDMRAGQVILHEGQLWIVHESQRVAKGNWRSYMAVKLKNFKRGNVVDFRFRMDEQFEAPFVEDRPFEYLYRDAEDFVLMNIETYDQVHVPKDLIPDGDKFLKGNERLVCKLMEGRVVGVELPNTVELAVTEAPPVVRGSTATNQSKEVVLETGYKVRVPPFITAGEVLRIDTRTGEYLERA